MMRYFIHFSFLGTQYHGWQVQPNAVTVQSIMEEALTRLLRITVTLTGCGRTDAGVHARMFYAHFDCHEALEIKVYESVVYRLNAYLPQDIVIHSLFPVPEEAHCRFSALSRTYQYFIHTRKDPFLQGLSWYYPYGTLDLIKLNKAASLLLHYNDFSSFSKKDTDINGTHCKLTESYWEQDEHHWVYTITANRFLRNMVRAIVGTLVEIGRGKWNENKLDEIISSHDRCQAGESVPACGLYLTTVRYPKDIIPCF